MFKIEEEEEGGNISSSEKEVYLKFPVIDISFMSILAKLNNLYMYYFLY